MSYRLLALSSVLLLAACAYAFEGTMREVTIVTPGAQNAVCTVFADGIRYRIHPPQTTRFPQSKEDLIVDCRAPGNRRKKVVVDSDSSVYGFLNIANAGIGYAWDLLSGAAYIYPRQIVVDFTGLEIRPLPLPAHNNPDIKQPHEYDLEEFLPAHPRLNSDKYAIQHQLRRRQIEGEEAFTEQADEPAPQGKGDLMTVFQDLRNEIDPTVSQPAPAAPTPDSEGDGASTDAPVPLFQGE